MRLQSAFCCCLFCLVQIYLSQGRPWEYKPSHQKNIFTFLLFVRLVVGAPSDLTCYLQFWPNAVDIHSCRDEDVSLANTWESQLNNWERAGSASLVAHWNTGSHNTRFLVLWLSWDAGGAFSSSCVSCYRAHRSLSCSSPSESACTLSNAVWLHLN